MSKSVLLGGGADMASVIQRVTKGVACVPSPASGDEAVAALAAAGYVELGWAG